MPSKRRQGATLLIMTAIIFAVVVIAGFTVDLAYIQLIRTQHKVAVDAAAKSAVEAMERTEDESEAIKAAKDIAKLHKVGGRSFELKSEDIEFGTSVANEDGSFTFNANEEPVNAVQIVGAIGLPGSKTASIPLFFPKLGHKAYQGVKTSAASYIINEVMLCLDRSGSMKFDMTGITWSYPPNNPYVKKPNDFWDNYYSQPHPTDSRWAILMNSVDVFMDEAENATRPPRVGLVTWSSSHAKDGPATVDFALPAKGINWEKNRKEIDEALDDRAKERDTDGVYGGTEMANGMAVGILAMETDNSHASANRIMILLTDGVYQGPDPIDVAKVANDKGITIHCITLLAGSTFKKMEEIAEATGGKAYMATDSSELQTAFRDIARSLNIVLTK